MNDIRRSILWVVFGFSMVLIWDKWQIHNGNAPTFFPSAAVTAPAAQDAPPATPADASVPGSTAATTTAGAAAAPQGTPAPAPAAVRHEVTTDVLKLVFNTEGGSLIGAELLKHASTTLGTQPFALLAQNDTQTYLAQSGLIFTAEKLKPKWSAVSPLQGFKRIFGPDGLVQFIKTFLKLIAVGVICWLVLKPHLRELENMAAMPPAMILPVARAARTAMPGPRLEPAE